MAPPPQPFVTLGITTRNRSDSYLPQTLDSAIKQTYQNIEIIVSDDGSTDNTAAVVTGFSDPRIRYFKQPTTLGAVNNYNFCVNEAKGDYFLLLHDDDLIDEDFVETCMTAANDSVEFGIIRTGTRIIDDQGTILRAFPNRAADSSTAEFFRGWFSDRTVWYLCSTLYNTKKLREVGAFEAAYPTWPEGKPGVLLGVNYARVDVKDVKASFREHGEEMTGALKMRNWCEDSLRLLELICQHDDHDTTLRSEGMRHFSAICYGIVHRMKSPLDLCLGYCIVFTKFKYPPPICYRFFYRNPTYRRLLNKLNLAKS